MNKIDLPTPESLKGVVGEMLPSEMLPGEMAPSRRMPPQIAMEQEQTYMPTDVSEQTYMSADTLDQQMATPIPSSAMEQEPVGENGVGAYGDFPPNDNVYFKPHGNMGDAASSNAGMLTSSQAACAHPVDNCNRFYCEGCGPTTCQSGGNYNDTDDIRRDYTEVITKIRAKRNHEYPFYIMS